VTTSRPAQMMLGACLSSDVSDTPLTRSRWWRSHDAWVALGWYFAFAQRAARRRIRNLARSPGFTVAGYLPGPDSERPGTAGRQAAGGHTVLHARSMYVRKMEDLPSADGACPFPPPLNSSRIPRPTRNTTSDLRELKPLRPEFTTGSALSSCARIFAGLVNTDSDRTAVGWARSLSRARGLTRASSRTSSRPSTGVRNSEQLGVSLNAELRI
jgi:hypothetical protein